MLFHPNRAERLAGIADQLRAADTVTADLVTEIAAELCDRHATYPRHIPANIMMMIGAGVWAAAALEITRHALPRWQLRRLAYDDGEWYCSLSSLRELPQWLDNGVETHHSNLELALLSAAIEASLTDDALPQPTRSVPPVRAASRQALCCDNFA